MRDRFEEILQELGIEYSLPLHPDKQGVCKLSLPHNLSLQIEYRPEKNAILIASFLSEIPPGKFRENILKAGLKANHLYPQDALLSYSDKNNQLALFQYFALDSLTGKKLADSLQQFIKKAEEWRQGVETGNINALVPSQTSSKGMFGLMP